MPKIAKPPRSPKKTVPVIDETLWRSSTIPLGTTISKTIALKLYRINEKDLKSLPYESSETTISIGREMKIMPMFLYQESDIERVAWRKHGGPEGFDAYLEKLRIRWNKAFHSESFPQPASYNAHELMPCIRLFPQSKPSPGLLRLERTFPSNWLWEACNTALETRDDGRFVTYPSGYSRQEREEILGHAVRELGFYPARPVSPLPTSNSITAFHLVIDRAPKAPDDEGMESDYDGYLDETSYHWNQTYMDELFQALINVIKEHGTGESGWESVRWAVYDKYCSCFGGICYADKSWYDCSKDWLRGYIVPGAIYTPRKDQDSEVGQIYNKMLPIVPL